MPSQPQDYCPNYVVHKFGRNPAIAKDTTRDIRFAEDDWTVPTSAVGLDMSSSDATDTQPVELQFSEAGYTHRVETRNLNGQSRVPFPDGLMVFRGKNKSPVAAFAGDVYVYDRTETTVTAGVPQTAGKIQIKIGAGLNQTQTTTWMVPKGHRAWIVGAILTLNELAVGTSREAAIELQVQEVQGTAAPFLIKGKFGLQSAGTSALPIQFSEDTDNPNKLDYPISDGMTEGCMIKWRASATGATCDVSVDYKIRVFEC